MFSTTLFVVAKTVVTKKQLSAWYSAATIQPFNHSASADSADSADASTSSAYNKKKQQRWNISWLNNQRFEVASILAFGGGHQP